MDCWRSGFGSDNGAARMNAPRRDVQVELQRFSDATEALWHSWFTLGIEEEEVPRDASKMLPEASDEVIYWDRLGLGWAIGVPSHCEARFEELLAATEAGSVSAKSRAIDKAFLMVP